MESQISAQVGVALLAALVIAGTILGRAVLRRKKTLAGKSAAGNASAGEGGDKPQPPRAAQREQDALYQSDRIVARVLDAEVDEAAKQVRFGEVFNSDELLLPDECEFQKYKILVQSIAYATKIDTNQLHKGRILRGVTAGILGYREQ